jgi:hypothetical protein
LEPLKIQMGLGFRVGPNALSGQLAGNHDSTKNSIGAGFMASVAIMSLSKDIRFEQADLNAQCRRSVQVRADAPPLRPAAAAGTLGRRQDGPPGCGRIVTADGHVGQVTVTVSVTVTVRVRVNHAGNDSAAARPGPPGRPGAGPGPGTRAPAAGPDRAAPARRRHGGTSSQLDSLSHVGICSESEGSVAWATCQ